MPVDERHRADGVFEGGGVKGIAFAGAIAAAERDAGVQEWVNLAGTSAGSIVAALLVAGYDATGIQKLLADAKYSRFADTGTGRGLGQRTVQRRRAAAWGRRPAATSSSGWASSSPPRRWRRSWARASSPSPTSGGATCRRGTRCPTSATSSTSARSTGCT